MSLSAGAMFDQTYLNRAMEMTKTGNQFFWEPSGQWHFAAQRHHKIERYTKTLFSVLPIFHETRLEIWPGQFNIQRVKFRQPYPNIIMLYHGDMCVWNRMVKTPKDENSVVSVEFDSFLKEAIIVIKDIPKEMCESLRRNWVQRR